MFFRSLMIVCLALSGSAARAGLIFDDSVDQQLVQSKVSTEAMTAWFELQQGNDPKSLYLHGQCDDMRAVNPMPISIVVIVAESSDGAAIETTPLLVWQFALANSSLPPTPVLDGLLKPA